MRKNPELSTKISLPTIYFDSILCWTMIFCSYHSPTYSMADKLLNYFMFIQMIHIILKFASRLKNNDLEMPILAINFALFVFYCFLHLHYCSLKLKPLTFFEGTSFICFMLSSIGTIHYNYKNKNVGPITDFNYILNLIWNFARLFTFVTETGSGSRMIVLQIFICIVLDSIVAVQIFIYPESNNKEKQD